MLRNHIAIYIIDIIALFFLFGLLHSNNFLSKQRKRSFSYGIVFTVLVILSEGGTILVSGGSAELRSFNIFFNVIGFALTPVIPIVLIAIFDTKILQMHKLILLPTILNFVAVTLSPLFGWIFYVDANNYYQRGSVFFFFVIVYIINIIFLAIITLYTGQKYLYPIKWKTASLSFFTVAGTCIQLLVPSVYSSWHCVTLSLLLLYILLSEFEGSFDTLTGLYNRAAFDKASKQLKGKKKFSVIVMDINNFKEINDTYGHEYGDNVLKEVAAIIRGSFDDNCSCYRVGGDEFYTIRRDANRDKLEHQLMSITNNLTKERQKDRYLPTVAYGYSIFHGDKTLDFQKILKEADNQMYYYKHLQKNSI
jgi:diguanylate cyclase (GGDEF)-like protein